MISTEKGYAAGSRKDAILAKYGVEPSREREILAGEPVEDIITGPARVQMYLKAIQRQSVLEKEAERKEEKEPPIEETPLYKAIVRARSGKSPVPTPEEVDADAAGLPTYRQDTYDPSALLGPGSSALESARVKLYLKAIQRQSALEKGAGGKKDKELTWRTGPQAEAMPGSRGEGSTWGFSSPRGTGFHRSEEGEAYGFGGKIGGLTAAEETAIEEYERAREAVGRDVMPSYGAAAGAWTPSAAAPVGSTYAAASGVLKSDEERERQERLAELGKASRELSLPSVAERMGLALSGAGKQYGGSLMQAGATAVGQVGLERIVDHFSGPMGSPVPKPMLKLMTTPLEGKLTDTVQDFSDKVTESGAWDLARAEKGLDPAGRMLVKTGVGAAQMAGDAALAAATGGSAKALMMARVFGGGVQEARAKGYDPNQQVLLGLSNAATEYFSERLFGGNPIYDSDVGLVNRLVGKIVKNPTVMEVLSSAPVDLLTEGLEEVVSDLLAPVAEWAITGTTPEYELEQIIEDGVVGVLTALIAKGGSRVLKSVLGKRKGAGQVTDNRAGQPYQDPLVREIWRVFGEGRTPDSAGESALDSEFGLDGKTGLPGFGEKPGRDPLEGSKLMKDYQYPDGTLDVETAKLDYKRLLQKMPEKNKMYLEQALDAAEFEVSENPKVVFGYDSKTDKFVYNPLNKAFGYYDSEVMFTHELAHRVDRFFVGAARNERFVKAIQDAGKILGADPEFFIQFCKENDREGFCSDILSAICKGKYKFPVEHEEGYWSKCKSRPATETFANLFSMEAYRDTEKMEFLRRYFPELIASFEALEFYIY